MHDYQAFLAASGVEIFEADGFYWQNYKGLMLPAYLPHEVPAGIAVSASLAMKMSKAALARWTENFDRTNDPDWWFVVRDGVYSPQSLSQNTRSKLNRGKRRLEARLISADEISVKGYQLCQAAVARYGRTEFLPSREVFAARVEAAALHPSSMEFLGVFREGQLVAFSENHIQGRGVFLESIWYEPSGLKDYSSYVLMDAILEEYIVRRNFGYVSDGSRSIYHETGVHDFLIEKFEFRRAHASMHLLYSPLLACAMLISRPLRGLIAAIPAGIQPGVLRKLAALHSQEKMATSVRRLGIG